MNHKSSESSNNVLYLLTIAFIGYTVWQEYSKLYGGSPAPQATTVGDRTQTLRDSIVNGSVRGQIGETGLPSNEIMNALL